MLIITLTFSPNLNPRLSESPQTGRNDLTRRMSATGVSRQIDAEPVDFPLA